MKKKATYQTKDGPLEIEYDDEAPCKICGLPVVEASMGGTSICPWCDSGCHRDGRKWTWQDYKKLMGPKHDSL